MRKSPNKISAKDLLADLVSKDRAEAKNPSFFFVPKASSLISSASPKPIPAVTSNAPQSVGTKSQPLAVAPPTEEELGISWTDKLKKILTTRRVVLVVSDSSGVKLLPLDDASFTAAAKVLEES